MTKSFVKKGDKVLVITGKDKGKTADVLEVSPKTGKVLVEGINVVTKHQKPKSQQDKGGIVKKSAPIEASNVMVVCPVCNKATRVKHKEIEGKNVRVCSKCTASLDKEFVKATKKDAKKAVKEAKTKKTKKEDKGE
ncbi:MAG: 50S ribosomal protein L24 [Clostridiales bacterium]|nr:50S ribosomal protein L24 [Clostridiales bacterium]